MRLHLLLMRGAAVWRENSAERRIVDLRLAYSVQKGFQGGRGFSPSSHNHILPIGIRSSIAAGDTIRSTASLLDCQKSREITGREQSGPSDPLDFVALLNLWR